MPDSLVWMSAGVLGAVVGSFLNVCVSRWPSGESVIVPRSRCLSCEHAIAWYDNVPILSYALLRGRCRACDSAISQHYPIVELGTAGIWVAAVALHGPSLEAVRGALLLSILLGISLTDARHYIIPDQFSLGGLAIGIGLAALPGTFPISDALIGAASGFVLLWTVATIGQWILRKPAMGAGDIKMLAMIGAFLGLSGVLLTIFLGSFLGAVIFGPISWRTGRLVPFGVFLSLGAAITYGWGDLILEWYVYRILT